jgi:hypothetical protein
MARAKAHANLHTLSPILSHTLGHLDLLPHRECTTPEELKAAWRGGERRLMAATARAYPRSQEEAKQRAQYSGKQPAYVEEHGHGAA